MQTDMFKEETDVCFKEVVMSIIVFVFSIFLHQVSDGHLKQDLRCLLLFLVNVPFNHNSPIPFRMMEICWSKTSVYKYLF